MADLHVKQSNEINSFVFHNNPNKHFLGTEGITTGKGILKTARCPLAIWLLIKAQIAVSRCPEWFGDYISEQLPLSSRPQHSVQPIDSCEIVAQTSLPRHGLFAGHHPGGVGSGSCRSLEVRAPSRSLGSLPNGLCQGRSRMSLFLLVIEAAICNPSRALSAPHSHEFSNAP